MKEEISGLISVTVLMEDPKLASDIANYIEEYVKIDLSFTEFIENNSIDYYSNGLINYNFLNKDLAKIKINNFKSKYINDVPLNLILHNNQIYTINLKGEILEFDSETGKLNNKLNHKIVFYFQITLKINI